MLTMFSPPSLKRKSMKIRLLRDQRETANVFTLGNQRFASYEMGRRIDSAVSKAVEAGVKNAALLKSK